MVDIRWNNSGYSLNWKSPWGNIEIEQRPGWRDRGTVVIKTSTEGQVNLLFNPLLSNAYFFDQERAIEHITAIATLAENISDEELENLRLEEILKPITFQGKDCTCYLRGFVLRPALVPLLRLEVVVHPGKEKILHVDAHDMFPRHYISYEIALEELKAWMKRREQVI